MLTFAFIGMYVVISIIYLVHSAKILHKNHLQKQHLIAENNQHLKVSKTKFFHVSLFYASLNFVVILIHLVANVIVFHQFPQFPIELIYTLAILGVIPFLFALYLLTSQFLY
jgi:H+/gluconate symporter-like permease